MYEHCRRGHDASAESDDGEEEVHAGYGADETVYLYVLDVVHKSAVFPNAQSCYKGEQECHRNRFHETYHDCGYEEYAGNTSYYKVFHVVGFYGYEVLRL